MKLDRDVARAVQALHAKQAEDVVVLDVRKLASYTDFFLLASAGNTKQLVAMADGVRDLLRENGRRPGHVEGYPRQEWILLDYGDFIVHLLTPAKRSFYDIERLWGGAPRTELVG
jgi:ribosome-associated protein